MRTLIISFCIVRSLLYLGLDWRETLGFVGLFWTLLQFIAWLLIKFNSNKKAQVLPGFCNILNNLVERNGRIFYNKFHEMNFLQNWSNFLAPFWALHSIKFIDYTFFMINLCWKDFSIMVIASFLFYPFFCCSLVRENL